jgi:hypothetical protein
MPQIVYVDEYQPSSARVTLGDPIFQKSTQAERIQVRKLGAPSPIGMLLIVGILYFVLRS